MAISISRFELEQGIQEGDYFQALGIAPSANKIEIDVAAARLSRRWPDLAGQISAIAQALTRAELRSVHEVAWDLRDRAMQVLAECYGPVIADSMARCRRLVWLQCQRLLQYDLEGINLRIGPRGLRSLAGRGHQWVVDSVINASTMVVCTSLRECEEETAVRECWYATCPICRHTRPVACTRRQEPAAGQRHRTSVNTISVYSLGHFDPAQYYFEKSRCPLCGANGVPPSQYDDTYRFDLSISENMGRVTKGVGQRTGKVRLALLDRRLSLRRWTKVLERFYRKQQKGMDETLEEEERRPERTEGGRHLKRASAGSGQRAYVVSVVCVFLAIAGIRGCKEVLHDRAESRQNKQEMQERWRRSMEEINQRQMRELFESRQTDFGKLLRSRLTSKRSAEYNHGSHPTMGESPTRERLEEELDH